MFHTIAIILVLIIGSLASPALHAADAQPAGIAKRSTPVGAGDRAPEFTLEDQDGRPVTLSAEWKKRPVVLIFYRGYW